MGEVRPPQKGLLFQALTAADPDLLIEAEQMLIRRYGTVMTKMGPFRFDRYTDYYQSEMGAELWKNFYLFSEPVTLENIHRYKLESQSLELRYLSDGNRKINCDPGYLTLYQLGLLSTKAYSHRIYLSEGIYAECTLIAHGNQFEALPWTYPDYRTEEALAFFGEARKRLKQMIR